MFFLRFCLFYAHLLVVCVRGLVDVRGVMCCIQSWIMHKHGITSLGHQMAKAVQPCWLNIILSVVFLQRSTFSSHKPFFSE